MNFVDINWTDYKSQVSDHFTVGETLYLPSWKVYHIPSDEEKQNIYAMAIKMEQVRDYLGDKSINVNCWIRPQSVSCKELSFNGKDYNKFVGGAFLSAHISGKACDFTVSTITCNDVRDLLVLELEKFDLRMERKLNAGWVHLGNDWLPGKTRYFIP